LYAQHLTDEQIENNSLLVKHLYVLVIALQINVDTTQLLNAYFLIEQQIEKDSLLVNNLHV